MSQSANPVEQQCNAVLAQPCPYKAPPLMFMGGHSFCPCVCRAIRTAYIGGYRDGKAGTPPEVGIEYIDGKEQD